MSKKLSYSVLLLSLLLISTPILASEILIMNVGKTEITAAIYNADGQVFNSMPTKPNSGSLMTYYEGQIVGMILPNGQKTVCTIPASTTRVNVCYDPNGSSKACDGFTWYCRAQ